MYLYIWSISQNAIKFPSPLQPPSHYYQHVTPLSGTPPHLEALFVSFSSKNPIRFSTWTISSPCLDSLHYPKLINSLPAPTLWKVIITLPGLSKLTRTPCMNTFPGHWHLSRTPLMKLHHHASAPIASSGFSHAGNLLHTRVWFLAITWASRMKLLHSNHVVISFISICTWPEANATATEFTCLGKEREN